MRVEELWLRNYGCFEEVLVQFPAGVVGIVGANGAGKSTLVEGIAWVLFGQQSSSARSRKEGVRRSSAPAGDGVEGRVVFVHEGVQYTVHRRLKGKALAPDATVSSQEGLLASGAGPSSELLARLLGMDFVSFETSVFTRQKELALLSSLRPAERRERILRILRIDRIDGAVDACRTAGRDAKARLDASRAILEGRNLAELSATLDGLRSRALSTEKSLEALRLREAELATQATAIEEEGKALSGKERERLRIEKALAEKRRVLAALEERMRGERRRVEEGRAASKDAEALDEARTHVEELEAGAAALERAKASADELARTKAEIARRAAVAKRLAEDLEGIAMDKGAEADAEKARAALEKAEKARNEAAVERAEAAAKAAAARDEREREGEHLASVRRLGRDAECPTCGRRLGEHHGALLEEIGAKLGRLEKAEKEHSAKAKEAAKREKAHAAAAVEAGEALKAAQKRVGAEAAKAERRKSLKARVAELEEEMGELAARAEALGKAPSADGLEEARTRLAKARERLAKCAAAARVVEAARKAEEALSAAAAEAGEADGAAKRLEAEAKTLGDTAAAMEAWRERRAEAALALERVRGAVREAVAERGHLAERSAALERDIASARKIADDASRLEAELRELSEAEALLAGFRDHMAGRVRPRLSSLASDVLGRMSGGKYPEASLDEDYELNLLSDGAMHPLRRFSGGEQDMANLALRLAVSEMVAETFGRGGLGLVILDEVFSSLDADYLRETMATLGALSGMFEQVLVVTHQEQVRDGMSHVIVVDGGGARIE